MSTTCISLDIGGSLTKIVFRDTNNSLEKPILNFINESSNYGSTGKRFIHLEFTLNNTTFHFISFETRNFNNFIDLIIHSNLFQSIQLNATGGGSIKYADIMKSKLNTLVIQKDEIKCLIKGLDYLVRNIPDQIYCFDDDKSIVEIDLNKMYPLLLVNVGTGVSIIKVDSPDNWERISGSGIGGGIIY